MKQILKLFVILILLSLPSCKFLKDRGIIGKKSKEKEIALLYARQDSIRVADSIRKVQELEATEAVTAAASEKEASPSDNKSTVPVSSGRRFSIIVGSFSNHENAVACSQEYRLKGYSPEIIRSDFTGNELVVIESSDSFIKLVNRTKELRDGSEPEAWLYEEK